jgi:Asp/Glu/hydantoin racemase
MRILVINPNASVELSNVVREQLLLLARPDVHVDVVNPVGVPPFIELAPVDLKLSQSRARLYRARPREKAVV